MKTKDRPTREVRKPKKIKPSKEYLLNLATREIHHTQRATVRCRINQIREFKEFDTLEEARAAGGDLCSYCFQSER